MPISTSVPAWVFSVLHSWSQRYRPVCWPSSSMSSAVRTAAPIRDPSGSTVSSSAATWLSSVSVPVSGSMSGAPAPARPPRAISPAAACWAPVSPAMPGSSRWPSAVTGSGARPGRTAWPRGGGSGPEVTRETVAE